MHAKKTCKGTPTQLFSQRRVRQYASLRYEIGMVSSGEMDTCENEFSGGIYQRFPLDQILSSFFSVLFPHWEKLLITEHWNRFGNRSLVRGKDLSILDNDWYQY